MLQLPDLMCLRPSSLTVSTAARTAVIVLVTPLPTLKPLPPYFRGYHGFTSATVNVTGWLAQLPWSCCFAAGHSSAFFICQVNVYFAAPVTWHADLSNLPLAQLSSSQTASLHLELHCLCHSCSSAREGRTRWLLVRSPNTPKSLLE